MAQLVRGKLVNVFTKPTFTNRETGEIKDSGSVLQFADEKVLKNGEKELFFLNIKVLDHNSFRPLVGKVIQIAVQDTIYEGKKYMSVVPDSKPEVV